MTDLLKACRKAQEGLYQHFWDEDERIMHNTFPYNKEEQFCYWWHAHVIDAFMDAYLRTHEPYWIKRIDAELDGVFHKNKGVILNDYYDDMEWMALALLRVWDATGEEKYHSLVLTLWEDIQTAWNDIMGGGMAWRKPQLDYKNTPANAPAAILALRLYERFHRQSDLEWGNRIYEWNKQYLMDPETGFIWDGMNRMGDGKIDYDWEYTYCQGVFIGASLELYKITQNSEYLAVAKRTAAEAKKRFADGNEGMLPDEGKGDCGLFKGILVRYLRQLLDVCGEMNEVREMLLNNAYTLAEKGLNEQGLIGGNWVLQPSEPIELSTQLSGIFLLEAAVGLQVGASQES